MAEKTTDDLLSQIVAAGETGTKFPEPQQLTSVAAYAKEMRQLDLEILRLKQELKDVEERLLTITTVLLPDFMKSIGLKKFTLDDDTTLSMGTEYYGSISEENKPQAMEWMRAQGHGSLVKNEIKLSFGMGEDADADKLKKRLEKAGYSYEQKEGIHASTLKAFIKEQTEAGVILPEVFNSFVQDVVKIAKKKGAK